ncbi:MULTISPECIES: hypothetical protein [unclassified Streptomyces]|uniref:hypothetical protein n=1 Tax=unclassified Streptomyces TaxID=2593676 RepID=UPI00136F1404|nr:MULTISPECIES: hypothetical protein [unclassified Streptomyces]NDZ98511.1 hypothetical protein [Streptomyces sp. SID10116]MYY79762.1 hypothetical protein [Streptomyces sp. SID335]MYZ16534.1 hypothetical protein [Streptomyces sp. SID337]NDZ84501.1 hypothetical protein [Streptomyces sp. SID10115]NEB43464.1 hypothetical protein [Streptomyces sp. SID339]
MPLISTLVDSFQDNIIGPEWGNSYGGVSETGGRARIPCVAGSYAGYQTAKVYTLVGSSVYLQVPVAAAAASATVEAQTVFAITPDPTQGTNLAININTVAGTIRFESNVAYTDGAAVSLTYSAVTHLWLRIRETGGNVLWDTSTDGSSWTNRRTLATPAWVASSTTLALDLWSYRNNGTTNFAEFDNVNTPASSAAVYFASAALTADGALTAAATRSIVVSATLTAESALDAATVQTAVASAALSGGSELGAKTDAVDTDDITVQLSEPRGGWTVSEPWI